MNSSVSHYSKTNVYYLMRDILGCFPDKFEDNFLSIINHHLIAKESTRKVLMDEIKASKPKYKILTGALILQNSFLRQMQRVAIYEVIDVLEALKYCLKKSGFIKVRRLSAQVILRLFVVLYCEYIMMPTRRMEGKPYLDEFKKFITQKDLVEAININDYLSYWIFKDYYIDIGYGEEVAKEIKAIISKFYDKA